MGNIIWIIIIGFVAGLIARFLSPGPNNPQGFILTTALGIAGAFLATFIGQSVGWYRLDQGAGLVGATVGAIIILAIWHRLVAHNVVGDPGAPGAAPPRRWLCCRPQQKATRATMGLLDVVNGMLAGPRGQVQEQPGASSGGMSPIAMALMGLLAYKAFKGRTPQAGGAEAAGASAGNGGLGGLLGGLLGGSEGSQPG